MTEKYMFADRVVSVQTIYPEVHAMCHDYLAEGTVCFYVKTTQPDIDFEREKSAKEAQYGDLPGRMISDRYLETLAVYRQIAERMPDYDTILFHGSAIAVDGEAYLFTAKSGTGKSTHTRLWRDLLGDKAVMVNDDKPLIRVGGGPDIAGIHEKAIVYGTPWDGKHHLSSNIAVPLKTICILERAEKNSIREITGQEAFPMLLQQTYRPRNDKAMIKTLELVERLAGNIRFCRLRCNMDIEAAQIAWSAMRK